MNEDHYLILASLLTNGSVEILSRSSARACTRNLKLALKLHLIATFLLICEKQRQQERTR